MTPVTHRQHPLGVQVPVYREAAASVWEMFAARSREQPGRPAVGDPRTQLSYGELHAAALGTAAYLREQLGVAPGDRVALYLPNRVEYGALLLGCLALKAIAVPLNTRLADPELAALLDNAGARWVIAEATAVSRLRQLAERLGEAGGGPPWSVLDVDDVFAAATSFDLSRVPAPAVPDAWDPAVILYTSGTTGTPKGAIVSHLNLVGNVINFHRAFGTGPDTRTLMPVPFYHVTGLLALFLHTVCVGGFVRMLPEFRTETFLDWMEGDEITYTCVVPAIYTLAVHHPSFPRRNLRHWRVAAYGGSPMPVEIIRHLVDRLPGVQAVNTYGATEVTGSCTFLPAAQARLRPESVGRPTPIHRIRIVDDEGNELPPNTVGEIAISGGTLTLGYWNNAEATQREFRGGWWHSGDLGWLDAEGYLYVVGRKRETINRGGEKIYPLEVEEALYNFPGVLEAAVVGVAHPIFGQEVAAAVVPRPGHAIDREALRAFLAERLADYKVPRRIAVLDALPKNPAGKVLKEEVRRRIEAEAG